MRRTSAAWRAVAGLAVAPALCLAFGASHAATPATRAAWLDGERVVVVDRNGVVPPAASLATPLGSVWKLFVYSYLQARGAREPAYRCEARQRQADDDYCCDAGGSVERDEALARSCGPYFDPARVGIAAPEWSRYWGGRGAPAWLARRDLMRPDTEVPVVELLQALRAIAPEERLAARRALLPLSVRDDAVLAALGSGPRFKTWSWHRGGERVGGAAGWRADGSPFWLSSAGTSRVVLNAQAAWLAAQWARPVGRAAAAAPVPAVDAAVAGAQPCVVVRFFSRYPIVAVGRADGAPAAAGPLQGRYVVAFTSGTRLPIDAGAQMTLQHGADDGRPRIDGRFALDDYVARVVDREGRAVETGAARALAVAARTYVLQNAAQVDGCLVIDDDSRTQRVSPNPPDAAAREAAAFTQDLVVSGVAVRYHRDREAPGVLSWSTAVAAGRRGEGFEGILRAAYPGGTLAGADTLAGSGDCTPLPQAQAWLAERRRRWREVLDAQPGYEAPGEGLRICRLAMGVPTSDQRRMLIRVREWTSREGRVTLIHEYLHLAFRDHPNGRDEDFIEQLAQRLADS